MNDKSKDKSHPRNEGEGNKTAAPRYNQAQRQFAGRGKVEARAHAAEGVLDSAERDELDHAELVGERHVAEEGPGVKKR